MNPYYQNDSVTLYHGDCFEVMRELQGPFDAAITDPPYGITQCAWDVKIDLEGSMLFFKPTSLSTAVIYILLFM